MRLLVGRALSLARARRTVHRFWTSSLPGDERQRYRFIVVAVTGLAVGTAIVRAEDAIALIAPATLGVLLLLLLQRFLRDPHAGSGSDTRLLRWTMAAFASHLLFGLIVTYTPAAVQYLGGDAYGYHIFAKWMLEFGKHSLAERLPAGKEGFFYLLLGLYKVVGPHMEAGLAVNAALGAALVPLVTDSTRRVFGPGAAQKVAPIVVLMPSFFLFTSQLLKEAPILFLFAVATNAALRIVERVSLSACLVAAVSLSLLLTLRAPVAMVGGAGLLLGIAFGRREVLAGLTTGMGTLAVLAVMVVAVGIGSSGIRSALQRSTLAESNRQRTGLAFESNSAFGGDVDTGTPQKAIAYLPIALTTFSFGPFPWQIRGLRQLPVVLDVLALWILWPHLFRGIAAAARKRARTVRVLLAPALAMACVLSLSIGNFGVLMRERMQVVVLLVPFIAGGMALKDDSRELHQMPPPAVRVRA